VHRVSNGTPIVWSAVGSLLHPNFPGGEIRDLDVSIFIGMQPNLFFHRGNPHHRVVFSLHISSFLSESTS